MIASGVSLVQKIKRLRRKQNYDQDPIHATEAKQETKQSKLLRVGKNSDNATRKFGRRDGRLQ